MRQNDIQIGMQACVRIGSRLAAVTVVRRLDGGGSRGRTRYECLTADTGRTIRATAARLRPMPSEAARAAAAEVVRKIAARALPPAPATQPETTGGRLARPGRLEGVRLNARRRIEQMGPRNTRGIERCLGAVHVAEPLTVAFRRFLQAIGRRSLREFPVAFRRGAAHRVFQVHRANRRQYCETMRHAPLPSEEMVARALAGDPVARAAVLAG